MLVVMDTENSCNKCGLRRGRDVGFEEVSGYRITAFFACNHCHAEEDEQRVRDAYRLLVAWYLRTDAALG
jgi:hypothetical protein